MAGSGTTAGASVEGVVWPTQMPTRASAMPLLTPNLPISAVGVAMCAVLVDVVSEFLEAALHTILYSRELYPLSTAAELAHYQRP